MFYNSINHVSDNQYIIVSDWARYSVFPPIRSRANIPSNPKFNFHNPINLVPIKLSSALQGKCQTTPMGANFRTICGTECVSSRAAQIDLFRPNYRHRLFVFPPRKERKSKIIVSRVAWHEYRIFTTLHDINHPCLVGEYPSYGSTVVTVTTIMMITFLLRQGSVPNLYGRTNCETNKFKFISHGTCCCSFPLVSSHSSWRVIFPAHYSGCKCPLCCDLVRFNRCAFARGDFWFPCRWGMRKGNNND